VIKYGKSWSKTGQMVRNWSKMVKSCLKSSQNWSKLAKLAKIGKKVFEIGQNW
jgi:hypothetical protein